jgi:hypothetical protein
MIDSKFEEFAKDRGLNTEKLCHGDYKLFVTGEAYAAWQAASAQNGGEPVKFTCHGNSAPAYSCDKLGDMSGIYYTRPFVAVPDDSKHHAVMQAQMWAQEARTQKAIVKQIGEIVGCANDWEMVEAVKAALDSAVVPEWIKCSERLTTERCLAYTPNNEDAVITLRIVPTRMLSHLSDVTHWMLLPEPPKQDSLN